MSNELNPDHPITQAIREHWQKIAALLLWKLKADFMIGSVRITGEDIEAMRQAYPVGLPVVMVYEDELGLELELLSEEEAVERIAVAAVPELPN